MHFFYWLLCPQLEDEEDIFRAAKKNDLQQVLRILQRDPDATTRRDERGKLPFAYATDPRTVQVLLKNVFFPSDNTNLVTVRFFGVVYKGG